MINLAIIGTGGMAHSHAQNFSSIKGVKLVAACDIVPGRARTFADEFNIPEAFLDVDELLTKSRIDAVAVVTPDSSHAAISLKAIAAGKHVLCEKPLATCFQDAKTMAEAAGKANIINMVNLSYRNSAAIQKAHQLVEEGVLGRIIHIEASYLQGWLANKVWGDWRKSPGMLWRLSTRHGSAGVLGDIGVHILDFTTYAAGDIKTIDCRLKTFPKVDGDKIGEYILDANDSAIMMAEMVEGGLAVIHTSRWATGQKNSLLLRIYGDKGALVVDLDKSYVEIQLCRGKDVDKAIWKTQKLARTPSIYERFIKSIRTGVNDQPDFTRGAHVQKMLDACFESDRLGKSVEV